MCRVQRRKLDMVRSSGAETNIDKKMCIVPGRKLGPEMVVPKSVQFLRAETACMESLEIMNSKMSIFC